ncbi:MAG TPA: GGDEF domain-containing protein [Lachnospiraceae bacterium]|nr:GGDEF domain-containing protein [Lachnospiraceae bacterium]
MKLREDKFKVIGILLCILIGFIILIADILFSKVDIVEISGNELRGFSENWEVKSNSEVFEHVLLPANMDVSVGDSMLLTKTLPDDLEGETYIFFRSSHQLVNAYINGKKIYSFGWGEERLFSKTPGCAWIVIPIDEGMAGATFQVAITGVYDRFAGMINEIQIGDKSAIVKEITDSRIGSTLICIILLIAGAVIVLVCISLENTYITTSLFRLGVFSIVLGIWSISVTNLLQIFYGDVFRLLNITFFSFTLLLPIVLWFIHSFEYYKKSVFINVMFWISVAEFMAVEILQLTNVLDYMQTLVMTHILMAMSIIYLVIKGIKDIVKNKKSKESRTLILSLILLIVFVIADITRYYMVFTYTDDGFYTRIGMLLFIIIWAVEIIRDMSRAMVKMTETKMLALLAYKDQMTGLQNRTAFEEKLKEYRDGIIEEETIIVEFDMNNLKIINDNFGHAKGDLALVNIANIIRKEFQDLGNCYRIGGDEICVILTKTNPELLEEKLQDINRLVREASERLELKFSVAWGYYILNQLESRNIDVAYIEADRMMYEIKKKMKCLNKNEKN